MLKKILEYRREQNSSQDHKLSDEGYTYLYGIKGRIIEGALVKKRMRIPERYYNMFYGKETENMHLFISREDLNKYGWGNFSDFNSEKGPNLARESKIIHALFHAIQYALDDHEGKITNRTAVNARTGEKCWQEFFSLFEVYNPNNNVSGLNTEDIINYDVDSFVGDICKTKPTFRSDIYLCYYCTPEPNAIMRGGYLEVNETGNNLLVSEDGMIVAVIDDNAVQTFLLSGTVIDQNSGIVIYLKSKLESYPSNNISTSTTSAPVISTPTLSTQINCNTSTSQVTSQPQQSTNTNTIVGGVFMFSTTEPDGYIFYPSKNAAGAYLTANWRTERTIRKDFSDLFHYPSKKNYENLDKILKSKGSSCRDVFCIPTPSARSNADPTKVLTRQILIDRGINIDKFKEKVKQTESGMSSPINYPNIKDW